MYNNDTKLPVFCLSVKGSVSVLRATRSAKVRLRLAAVFVRPGCVTVIMIAEITGTKAPKIAVCNFDILLLIYLVNVCFALVAYLKRSCASSFSRNYHMKNFEVQFFF